MAGEELIEIILQAIDNASSVFESVSSSAEEVGNSIDNINGAGMQDASAGAGELEQKTEEADSEVQNLNNDLSIINASSLLDAAQQVGELGQQAEQMAQDMNEASITVGQLATQTGIAEPQMRAMVASLTSADFPQEEAMMYIKSLDQMGVSSSNLAKSASDIDMIGDAFGLTGERATSMSQELGVLGVDMNNVSSAFNALAYANANTVGGMDNYYNFLRKYDSQFKELGYNVDQTSLIIAAATQKYGGGRAALSGLSNALKEADGDSRKLEQALGMQAGSLDNATQITGQYEGQLAQLASEEAQHKTLLDQMGAAWDSFNMTIGNALAPLLSVAGAIGQVGQFGLQIQGITQLGSALKDTIKWIKDFNIAQTAKNLIEGEGAIASIAAAVGITTEAAAAEGATVAFGGLAIAEGAALWPILAIVAAIALFVAAAFEIGKAFGWWTDVGSMLEAIQAGIMRLWDAFINHPDVQALIQGITDAWNWLVPAVTGVVNAIMEFFGITTGGQFDFVRAVIDAIGKAWQLITFPIRTVISLVQLVTNVFNQFATGQMTLQGALISIWNAITTALASIFSRIINAVLRFGAQMLAKAIQAGRNFVNGIVNTLKSLPGRVFSIVSGVAGRIGSAIQHWVSTASSKVQSVIKAITSPFSGVVSSISGALNGVKNAITAPFRAAYDAVKPIINNIKSGIDMITNLPFGGEAYGGELAVDPNNGRSFNVNTGQYVVDVDNSPLVIEDNINLNLDLKNVPSNINTSQLIEALTNQNVLNALVDNRDFQDLDARVKQRINLKNTRARGR